MPCIDGFVKLTLAERRRYHTAVQVFKSIRKLSPVYLHDQFSNMYDLTGHFGRNQFILESSYPESELLLASLVFTIEEQSSGIS